MDYYKVEYLDLDTMQKHSKRVLLSVNKYPITFPEQLEGYKAQIGDNIAIIRLEYLYNAFQTLESKLHFISRDDNHPHIYYDVFDKVERQTYEYIAFYQISEEILINVIESEKWKIGQWVGYAYWEDCIYSHGDVLTFHWKSLEKILKRFEF